jgi:MFS family permease
MNGVSPRTVTVQVGTAQTFAWASSYYLPALLAAPLADELGLPASQVFVAFSAALIVSALVGPFSGRAIDRHGGRPVLLASSLGFALGLTLLGMAQGSAGLFAAWLVIGAAMGGGLYDAAFAALVRLYGPQARRPITGVTLMAGFASTIGWPATGWLMTQWGWRGACFAWAAVHLLINALLYLRLPPPPVERPVEVNETAAQPAPAPPRAAPRRGTGVLLAFVFGACWFSSTAMAAHLPRLMQATGMGLAGAVAIGALVGPAQVAGRLIEFAWLKNFHPLLSARLAALAHPVGVAVLLAVGSAAAPLFAVLHGMGNGILTIANGALPLALFGSKGFGARQGWLMFPARFAQAAAPLAFGLALDRWGAASLGLTAGLVLCALGALMLIRLR